MIRADVKFGTIPTKTCGCANSEPGHTCECGDHACKRPANMIIVDANKIDETSPYAMREVCPECGAAEMIPQEGCALCPVCGYSPCGKG